MQSGAARMARNRENQKYLPGKEILGTPAVELLEACEWAVGIIELSELRK
jgi:hypothetical protein